MQKIFQDLLTMDGVHGLVLVSEAGEVLFESFDAECFRIEKSTLDWKKIFDNMVKFREMDLVYGGGRYYMRQTENGMLLLSMVSDVSIGMVKLNCDIVIPEINKAQTGKGLKILKKLFKFGFADLCCFFLGLFLLW